MSFNVYFQLVHNKHTRANIMQLFYQWIIIQTGNKLIQIYTANECKINIKHSLLTFTTHTQIDYIYKPYQSYLMFALKWHFWAMTAQLVWWLGYVLHNLGFKFSYFRMSTLALGPTLPPTQWLQGSFNLVRQLGPLYSSSANIKKECSHSLLYLHALVARTGTI
jgi:hypothetical protein